MANLFVKLIKAVLNIPRSVPKKIEYYKTIYASMKESSYFTSLETKLEAFKTIINTFEDTQNAFKKILPTKTKADRDYIERVAHFAVKSLREDVQELANNNLPHAADIIEAAGMHVLRQRTRIPQVARVKDGPVPCSTHIMGEGRGNHNFRKSKDGEHWENMLGNGTSNLIDTDVEFGETYYYQSQKVFSKKRVGPWSKSCSLLIR